MARIIAVCNQKGGVGKTTTAVNVAAYLAVSGRRVLLVDFDPQANASSALGARPATIEKSIYHGIAGQHSVGELTRATSLFNFHFVPAAPHLAGMLVELVSEARREYFLRSFLHTARHLYDYIIIDLPPSLSLLTINGLVAADEVLIPVQAEYYSLEGLGQLLQTLELIASRLRHPLLIAGAVVTMYDARERFSREVADNLRANFPHHVFSSTIPRDIALAEAPSFSRPIILHSPSSAGAAAYRALANEILRQQQDRLHIQLAQQVASPDFGNFNILPLPDNLSFEK